MKLSAREAASHFDRPDPRRAATLIYGADGMRVALKRQALVAALIGPEGEAEMRLTRLQAADLRKEPAAVGDALKAVGFFPGQRVVFVEDAADGAAAPVLAALEDWRDGDAHLVVTAGQLTPRSSLRKGFEGHPNAFAIAIYDDPPSRGDIEATLQKAGLTNVTPEGMDALLALGHGLDPGDFRQTVEKLALYKLGDRVAVSEADVAACAPLSLEAGADDLIHIVAEGRAAELGPMLRRLEAQGVTPVSLCIQVGRHFRALHTAASDPGGPGKGIGKLRPPLYGPRRDRMLRQTQSWGVAKLEGAMGDLMEADLALRSAGQAAPAMALVERALIRVAMRFRAR